MILIIVAIISVCNGFLLPNNNTGGTGLTGQHLEQLVLKLNNEVKSLQQLAGLNQGNVHSQEVTNLQNGYSELQKKFRTLNQELVQVKQKSMQVKNDNTNLNQELTRLKSDHSALSKKTGMLQSEIYVCGNDTMELRKGLEIFSHFISGWELNNTIQIQSKFESLENKMAKTTTQLNVLASSSNSDSQHFLTLLNQTKDTQHKMTILDTETKQNLLNYQTSTNNKIMTMENYMQGYKNSINQTFKIMATELASYVNSTILVPLNQKIETMGTLLHSNQVRASQNMATMETDLQSYQHRINDIFHKIAAINQTVVLTSCADIGSFSSGSVVTFINNKTVYGISDVSMFKSSGKFTCEVGGVYLFSVFIMSESSPSQYRLYKNNDMISYVNIVYGSNNGAIYHSGTGIVAASLDVGDILYVTAVYDMHVNDKHSCMTVIKIT